MLIKDKKDKRLILGYFCAIGQRQFGQGMLLLREALIKVLHRLALVFTDGCWQ